MDNTLGYELRNRGSIPFRRTIQIFKRVYMSNSRNTSELAVAQVENRFDLVLIMSKRVRELKAGHRSKITDAGGITATAQMEVERGHVGREYLKKV